MWSTAVADPHGYLVTRSRITGEAPDGYYKLARPWVPGSDPTAVPMLTVRDTWLGPGIDAVAPCANMRDAYPWQSMRFREYSNRGPGAEITVPGNRPQLTDAEARAHTAAAWLGDRRPRTVRPLRPDERTRTSCVVRAASPAPSPPWP